MKPEMNLSELHYMILNHIIQKGFAPESQTIAAYFGINDLQVVKSKLIELENYHGVVLHPNKEQIWIIHPFSTAPTNFVIETDTNLYWGNCAWCSLGAAALLQPKRVTITTSIGAEAEQVKIEIKDGRVSPLNLFVHFPVPMTNAWDNVVYTCSVMLFFNNGEQIEEWCDRHHIAKGDVQSIERIWEFAKTWYGNHLSRSWKKWTGGEAAAIFRSHGLAGPTWELAD